MKRVVIVGGGLTGLTVAHALEKAKAPCAVQLVEAAPHLGGTLQTLRYNGFILDAGLDSWDASVPEATRLAREMGLGDELIGRRPEAERMYIAWQRQLHPIPERLLPEDLGPFVQTELLGWDAKLRAGLDRVIPPRRWGDGEEDESVETFVSRRLGADVAERITGPRIRARFGGDPAALSVRACAPALVRAEEEHGSLLAAIRAAKEGRNARVTITEGVGADTLSLERGLGDLVVNVAHKLRDAEVLTSRRALAVARLPADDPRGRWIVETSGGPLHADDVVLAVPAWVTADLVADEALADLCRAIAYTSVVHVFLAYRKYDVRHPLDAAGVIVPRPENRPILACAFVSSEWDHRAPAGQVLLRAVLGGTDDEGAVERSDEELVAGARAQIRDLLGIDRPPSFAKVFRFARNVLQPRVGHHARMARIRARAAAFPGLHVDTPETLGVSAAVREGEAIAARITPLRT